MLRLAHALLFFVSLGFSCSGIAQSTLQTSGALIIVPANSEVRHPNDEARVTLMIEEQDKDKAAAASRVNQKMKEGTRLVKRLDPSGTLKTHGYYTYPVYPDDQLRQNVKSRDPVAWRVGQYLEVTTTDLSNLPSTVASVQRLLALNGLQFGLSEATKKKMDEQRIAVAYQNLTDRIEFIAKAMGRNMTDAVIETIDFDPSGNHLPKREMAAAQMSMRSSNLHDNGSVEEPSFEPGETVLEMRVVGKVKFN